MRLSIRQIVYFTTFLFIGQSALAVEKKTEVLDDIVVSGSRTSQRTTLNTPTPVDIFDEEDIKNSGITRTDKLLESLVPSIQIPKPTISDGTDSLAPIALRRLGTDHVLVLINGKRRHKSALVHINNTSGRGSASTDLSAIPVNAIKKIEVLRDGASAVYGSDAIAGVINIVLKDRTSANSFGANTGIYQKVDGAKLEGLFNYTNYLNNYALTWSGKAKVSGRTDRAGADLRCNYVRDGTIPCSSQDSRELSFDRDQFWYGDSQVGALHLWYNLERKGSESRGIYSFGGASYRNSLGPGFYRQAKSNRNHPEIYPDGFLPKIRTHIIDVSSVLGYRSRIAGWDSDLSFDFGYNSFNFGVENSLNVSYGPTSPTKADAGTLSEYLVVANADFRKQKGQLWGSPLFWALGVGSRVENYSITAGDELSWRDGGERDQFGGVANPGIQVFPGFNPDNELSKYRFNLGGYAEASSQFNKLFAQAATRGEYYSDFGFSLTNKLSAQYQATRSLGFRSSLSTGFRAPSLSQKYLNNTATLSQGNKLVQVGTFNEDSAAAKAIGLPSLKEETSYSASAGVTYGRNRQSRTTIDAYYTLVKDRVLLSRQYQKSDFGNLLSGNEYASIAQLQFFTNGMDLLVRGVDVVHAGYRNLKGGKLSYSAAFNWGDTKIVDERDPEGLQTSKKTLSRSARFIIESAAPNTILRFGGAYSKKDWKVSLFTNRYGTFAVTTDASGDDSDAEDQTFSAKWITNLKVTKSMNNNKYSVGVGINNLFDVYPDKNLEGKSGAYNGIFPYNRISTPYGFNGRFFLADVTYNL